MQALGENKILVGVCWNGVCAQPKTVQEPRYQTDELFPLSAPCEFPHCLAPLGD